MIDGFVTNVLFQSIMQLNFNRIETTALPLLHS